jgi:hypothetical protein
VCAAVEISAAVDVSVAVKLSVAVVGSVTVVVKTLGMLGRRQPLPSACALISLRRR